ncbi:hypothetical protein M436DRAFT_78186 [Aureobasidium namibiae CBS 147.97]|uniref:Uncharacterized protein n=1 Tax=Aureobasidium namibiae CBS 147.97 TaxID=1043004 RepID=A0A074WY32_9PEZI
MEPHQKGYIRSADLTFTNHDNSNVSAPGDEHMKDSNKVDAPQDNVTTTTIAQQSKQSNPVNDPRLSHPFYTALSLSRDANKETTTPHVAKRSINYPDILDSTTKAVSTPDSDHVFDTITTTSLGDLLKDPHHLGAMLASTYHTTSADEIKNIIGCLVHLDVMITRQTHLNELHEAHTAKNFREQRHLNKDRKLRLGAITKSIDHEFAGLDAQRMAQQTTIKQHDIRVNSHQVQLKGLNDKAQMLAQAGEWMETAVGETQQELTDLQREVEGLKIENVNFRDEVRGLREVICAMKEKEEGWERRLAALEVRSGGSKEIHLIDVCIKKEQVLNSASFAVGNARVFSLSR